MTALTLRQAIWHKEDPRWHVCGVPTVFYSDHGSDFTSKHLEQVAADLPMELIFSQISVPRGRGKQVPAVYQGQVSCLTTVGFL